jgi:hypothetical protein
MRIINLKLIGYLLRKNYIQIGIVFLVAAFAITRFVKSDDSFAQQWELWLEAAITFSIVGMTVLIWYNEQRQDWENSLSKKLNITYMLEKEVYCQVLNAPLASEGDIRAWAISIGGTILNEKVHIDFSGFKISKPKIDYAKNNNVYGVTVYLKRPIDVIKQGNKYRFDENGDLEKNHFAE